MDLSEAIKIVRLLSEGIDPETKEVLERENTFNNPNVIRALHVALNALERVKKTESRKSDLPINSGKGWTAEEDESLLNSFDEGKSISELAIIHLRTKGAILPA
jgi:hypothetical protein